MQCSFCALQPVRIQGRRVEGEFEAELDDVIEALVNNGLIEPVFAPEPPRETPVWEMEHCEA